MKLDFVKILDNGQDALALLNGAGEIVYRNAKARGVFADVPALEAELRNGGAERAAPWRETVVTRADGTERIFRFDTIQTYSHEEPLALLVIRDVTREKRLAEDEDARLRLEALNRFKNELIGVVSHEMRTPLAIVKNSLDALSLGAAGGLDEKQAKIADTALRNADRLGKLVEDFLDLSRLESGLSKIHLRKTDTDEWVEKCAAEAQQSAAAQKLAFSQEVTAPLPPVLADPGLLSKALSHVLHNALRFARSHVGLKAACEGHFVKITVSDDGPGIPKEGLDGIFEKFTQHGRPAGGSGYMGTGLGLTLANEIMTSHRGEIAIGSVPGRGTEVHLLVPIFDAEDALERGLDDARHRADADKNSFSLMAVVLLNFEELRAESSAKDIEWALTDVAKTVQRILRADDAVVPAGSDGVLHVVLAGSDRKEALLVSERIRRVTKDCFCPGRKGRIFVEAAAGIAVYPDDTADLDELVAEARAAAQTK